jgi:integrase
MPRSYPMAATINGKHVGFGLKKPGNEPTYAVFYRSVDGRRQKRDTKQTSIERAREAAVAILTEVHAPSNSAVETVSWDEALKRMKEKAAAEGRRGPTIDYYCKLIRRIRSFYSVTKGPADISESMAETWKKTFATTLTRRKRLPSQHTVFSLVRGYSALWQNWFVDGLGICPGNPWQDVEPPKTDKVEVRVIEDETLTHFLDWLDKRFSGWELPRLFIETKAVTGCRLMDLCAVESSQLRDGRLHFRPEQTKGRKARSVLLPGSLYAKLEAMKGPKYLWESYPTGLIEAVRKMGCPVHRIKPDFVAKRLYHWVETLFIDYRDENPDRPLIHSHQLRKRAFTAAWKNNIDPRKAAIAYGCNVDTVMKHYVNLDEQEITDEVTNLLAGTLAPKPSPAQSGASQNT